MPWLSWRTITLTVRCRPGTCPVFLDDADRCVAGAREAGIHAVHYQDNAPATEEIEKLLTTP
jgi:hypothetical protein